MTAFGTPVTTVDELREFVEEPHPHMKYKVIPVIDEETERFLAFSTYFLLATAAADGRVDVSPRGERPGGVLVLDERHIAFGDRPGNRRIDSFRNIVERPNVGLLFLVPGMRETVRVNGRATIVRDAPFLDDLPGTGAMLEGDRGSTPRLATVVEVEELFLHCGQAPVRGGLWKPSTWPEAETLPTVKELFYSQSAYWDEPLPGVERRYPKE
ncbi:MSMEG_1061 family FMN-dependent PPOX-type flavoprotein [Cryptosporangium phraense]|uniref:Pyridoxamine 5'-phosphate oxidase family protein n=1 Tax=Cryptosporangium phraense TaxID=2593070 RepID=A0A545AEL7_9ACTN|nr:MSMEG_1061 family FMN-dependent PPOX-type flavoprotein [Cryptosporangium phraense]TQS39778.1 pyridoxamine 5'-phosphate oxidase family protein [Cryptosporangium phraense]